MQEHLRRIWNLIFSQRRRHRAGFDLGFLVSEGSVARAHYTIPDTKRSEHIAILGKTGTGKSSLIRSLCSQDLAHKRGFVFFDLHGDATPYLLRRIALQEAIEDEDLSSRLIVIDPSDPEWSAGLNVLDTHSSIEAFVQVAEFTELLKSRWHLESLGARTEEALRNSLLLLAENGLTLLELAPLLTNPGFRASCLQRAQNEEVRGYFDSRYNLLSAAMQTAVREPLLNKISFFSGDPHFRHLVGQKTSTVSFRDAMEEDYWVILNLHKGRLGEEAITLASLFLAIIKNALFSREGRNLFTLYCDEIQNLIAYDSGLDTMLSESRKFSVSVVAANQYLEQYPPKMRAAILGAGTHVFFQLTGPDAEHIGNLFGSGRSLVELLKELPKRHMVVKSGSRPWQEVCVPHVKKIDNSYADLYQRSRRRWARLRTDIEREIKSRHQELTANNAQLKGWD